MQSQSQITVYPEIPNFAIPSDEESTMSVDGRILNLFMAQKLFVPIADADLFPLLHFKAETLLHNRVNRSALQATAAVGLRAQPQIHRVRTHPEAEPGVLQFPAIRRFQNPANVTRWSKRKPRRFRGAALACASWKIKQRQPTQSCKVSAGG